MTGYLVNFEGSMGTLDSPLRILFGGCPRADLAVSARGPLGTRVSGLRIDARTMGFRGSIFLGKAFSVAGSALEI